MKFPLKTAIAAVAIVTATPAMAALELVGSGCSVTTTDPDAIACAGAYAGNLNNNSRIDDLNAAVDILMGSDVTDFTFSAVEASKEFFEPSGQTLTFDTMLFGEQIFSFHFGGAGPGGDYTVLYLFDFGTEGASSVNLGANGFSNGVIVPPPPGAVPEPATWAMMLLGFAGIGLTLRARRRESRLAQIA
jgi:hypothetical protein